MGTPPSAAMERFDMKVISIDVTASMIACAKVVDLYGGVYYTDYLTLAVHDGRWVIACKDVPLRKLIAQESKPSPRRSSVRSIRLRRPSRWSARLSDHFVASIPSFANGSGGKGRGFLRTISS
ncbi:nuclear transport factor 2 family protein [Nocardioides ginsengisoli]|uniref:Nuclear transport factor 2 family protein n=1 Tax=Nocardioides ginsengisoli TaxID=363868 RepID=A0ABW3VVS5_9ACTN